MRQAVVLRLLQDNPERTFAATAELLGVGKVAVVTMATRLRALGFLRGREVTAKGVKALKCAETMEAA